MNCLEENAWKKTLSTLFQIHGLTGTHDWSVSLWLTGERELVSHPAYPESRANFGLSSPGHRQLHHCRALNSIRIMTWRHSLFDPLLSSATFNLTSLLVRGPPQSAWLDLSGSPHANIWSRNLPRLSYQKNRSLSCRAGLPDPRRFLAVQFLNSFFFVHLRWEKPDYSKLWQEAM